MLLIGLSWLLYWVLVTVFVLDGIKAALIVGLLFVILGLLIEGVPKLRA